MVLGKFPVPGRPTICIIVGQGPTALAVGAGACRPKAALLFWFFGHFRCGALLFMAIHIIHKYKNR